jgi:hypothetical protein
MSLHCGTNQLAIIFIVLVLINIDCTVTVTVAIVAAVIIGGRGILIERDMW